MHEDEESILAQFRSSFPVPDETLDRDAKARVEETQSEASRHSWEKVVATYAQIREALHRR